MNLTRLSNLSNWKLQGETKPLHRSRSSENWLKSSFVWSEIILWHHSDRLKANKRKNGEIYMEFKQGVHGN